MHLEIVPYKAKFQFQWDDFVLQESGNGTVFHTRKFLSYHPKQRFEDASILVFLNKELVAVQLIARTETGLVSHPGTSGGGLVLRADFLKGSKLCKIIEGVEQYLKEPIQNMLMPEEVFSSGNLKPLLHRCQQKYLVEFEPSMFLDLSTELESAMSSRMREGVGYVQRLEKFTWNKVKSEEGISDFHGMLERNLARHETTPVHTLGELLELNQILGPESKFFTASLNDELMAGVWCVRASYNVWHAQYIWRNYEASQDVKGQQYVLPTLIVEVAKTFGVQGAKVLCLGSCNGGASAEFSQGLCDFKERLGAKMSFRYRLTLKQ